MNEHFENYKAILNLQKKLNEIKSENFKLYERISSIETYFGLAHTIDYECVVEKPIEVQELDKQELQHSNKEKEEMNEHPDDSVDKVYIVFIFIIIIFLFFLIFLGLK